MADPAGRPADPNVMVIFGASGDLTKRKLVPALYNLTRDGLLSPDFAVIGVSRREMSDEEFRSKLESELDEHLSGRIDSDVWARLRDKLYYRAGDVNDPESYRQLKQSLEEIGSSHSTRGNWFYYLATAPRFFAPVVEQLGSAGLAKEDPGGPWRRVIFEKPFGHDLESARELNESIRGVLEERQIYRIDHYLGKETVQNVLLFRFGNAIFEPLLNRNHVDHVQITVAESQGIESGRGGYYDKAGALRDVLQNHVLQLLCLTAMEPPALFRAEDIRDEKMKVLEALCPGCEQIPGISKIPGISDDTNIDDWAIAGQYKTYTDEPRVPADSRTETYVAMQVAIDNWRWAGVPFYLRTGKRMPRRVTEIAIQFKLPPKNLFTTVECEGDLCELVGARPNTLVFRIQPKESISLTISTKRPGMQYQIHPVTMDFEYDEAFDLRLPEAYERLLLDVLRGDSTLFTRTDELEAAWKFVTPVLEHWQQATSKPHPYEAGTWGPEAAMKLLTRSGRNWRVPRSDA